MDLIDMQLLISCAKFSVFLLEIIMYFFIGRVSARFDCGSKSQTSVKLWKSTTKPSVCNMTWSTHQDSVVRCKWYQVTQHMNFSYLCIFYLMIILTENYPGIDGLTVRSQNICSKLY